MHLEHEQRGRTQDVERGPRERFGLALVDECLARLPVAHLRLERVDLLRADVRRVRDDEIERARREPVAEVAVDEVDAQTGAPRVLARKLERLLRRVHGDDVHVVELVREREGDRSGPRPDVEHPQRTLWLCATD